ncbi:hypothetical protein GF340_01695 [Candidatus Peregrinibacteria bacterium]|nr:hypothetical protein [Candidatus Peregrinibacteria bacterium]
MLSHENSYGQGKARKYAEASLDNSGLYGAAANRAEKSRSAPPESGERKSNIFGIFKRDTRKEIRRAINE